MTPRITQLAQGRIQKVLLGGEWRRRGRVEGRRRENRRAEGAEGVGCGEGVPSIFELKKASFDAFWDW